jgi:hypothetical protein
MTSKRTTKTDTLSSGVTARRPKRAGATHSRKAAAAAVNSPETQLIEELDEPQSVGTRTVEQDAIARLAYSYWEARGCVGGSPEDDWFRAEQELLNR